MCLVCVEFNAGRLTLNEAWRNLREMYETLDDDHREEALSLLYSAFESNCKAERVTSHLVLDFEDDDDWDDVVD